MTEVDGDDNGANQKRSDSQIGFSRGSESKTKILHQAKFHHFFFIIFFGDFGV